MRDIRESEAVEIWQWVSLRRGWRRREWASFGDLLWSKKSKESFKNVLALLSLEGGKTRSQDFPKKYISRDRKYPLLRHIPLLKIHMHSGDVLGVREVPQGGGPGDGVPGDAAAFRTS